MEGSTSDLNAGPGPSRRGSAANTTLIRMGEATALPLVLCGLLHHEFAAPFSPMPSRRSSQVPHGAVPTASSPLLLEQSMTSCFPDKIPRLQQKRILANYISKIDKVQQVASANKFIF
ncbi:hypothetical protein C0J52_11410 [Blattella germanica]|nr:hypothetical protein C0J52_11410 [Blattella germanica]